MIRISLPAFITLLAIAFQQPVAWSDDTWVAVGYGGRRLISHNGLKWEITEEWAQPGGDDGHNLMSAVFAEDKFVIVGGGGAGKTGAGHILVSTDGRTWQETHSAATRINPVTFGNGRFVAGIGSWPSGKLLWSDDAMKWNEGAAIASRGFSHFRHGAFGNGVFVLVGNGRTKNEAGTEREIHWVIVSPDGESIAFESADLPAHGDIKFGAGRFVMLSHEGVLQSSADGRDWKTHPFSNEETLRWLVWDGTKFLAGSFRGGWESDDGLTWRKGQVNAAPHVKWSDGKRFIATGWPGKMFFSADGRTWQPGNPLTENGINEVIYGRPTQPAEKR